MSRRRRPAEETRAEMLEVAQTLLMENGPAGVRLDAIAREVGVSRQAVLHHFGNREGLMRALVAMAWQGLFADLASLADQGNPAEFVDQVDEVARKRGNARLGAWLLLSGQGLPDDMFEGTLASIPESMASGDPQAAERVLLVGTALFGDAIFGTRLRQVLGLPDSEADRAAFRALITERAFG